MICKTYFSNLHIDKKFPHCLNVKNLFGICGFLGGGGKENEGWDPPHYTTSLQLTDPHRAAARAVTVHGEQTGERILTNWNSVADPAPASAFLSAPGGTALRL